MEPLEALRLAIASFPIETEIHAGLTELCKLYRERDDCLIRLREIAKMLGYADCYVETPEGRAELIRDFGPAIGTILRNSTVFRALAELVELKDKRPADYEERKVMAWQEARQTVAFWKGEP